MRAHTIKRGCLIYVKCTTIWKKKNDGTLQIDWSIFSFFFTRFIIIKYCYFYLLSTLFHSPGLLLSGKKKGKVKNHRYFINYGPLFRWINCMLRPECTQETRWAIHLLLLQQHNEDYAQGSIIQFEKTAKVNTDTVYHCSRVSRFVVWFW